MRTVLLDEIFAPIAGDLRCFEERLKRALSSSDDFIDSIFNHILRGRGKRLRPALVFFSAGICGDVNDKVMEMAVAIELVHTATLIHDDIVDMAKFRRRMPTINSKWSNDIAVIMGDYLYSKATKVLLDIRDAKLQRDVFKTAALMCEGEFAHMKRRFSMNMPESEYMDVVSKKTSSLMALACESGARLGGGSSRHVKAMKEYGRNFGMAFQIVDDILDIIGDQRRLGKTLGLDLKRGGPTLPLIYLYSSLSHKKNIKYDIPRLRSAMERNDVIRRSLKKAGEFAFAAKGALSAAVTDKYKKGLIDLLDYVTGRVRC